MVLHHVAQRARLLVIAGTLLDTELLGHVDRDARDVIAVPRLLEQRVAEAEREQVLHRLLAEVVIDPVDLRLVEIPVREHVHLLRRREIVSERLFDDEPREAAAAREVRFAQRLDRRLDDRGRQRKIENAVAGELVDAIELRDAPGELPVADVARLRDRLVVQRAGAPAPDLRRRREPLERRARERTEPLVVHPVVARDTEDPAPRREQAVLHQLEQRRKQLAPREITGRADDHEKARLGPAAALHARCRSPHRFHPPRDT